MNIANLAYLFVDLFLQVDSFAHVEFFTSFRAINQAIECECERHVLLVKLILFCLHGSLD